MVFSSSNQLTGQDKVSFLTTISELPKVIQNDEAFIESRSLLALTHIELNDPVLAKQTLVKAKEKLDATTGVDASVYSTYYRAWASYYKLVNVPEEFYQYAIKYIAYTQLDSIPKQTLVELAFDLGIAALVGETIFNFGDLLEHPVIESLQGTDNQWMADVIYTFNTGNITKWKELQNQYSQHLNSHAALTRKHELLDRKIRLMALVELAFSRTSGDRNIQFDDISRICQVDDVEMLIMRALSLGLIRGDIDEVSNYFSAVWVQPRILNMEQIADMGKRLDQWETKVKKSLKEMESGLTSELVS